MTTQPGIEAIKALDGKIFAMLTPDEEETPGFYRNRGRKFGVSIVIALATARTEHEACHILKNTNARVRVIVSRCERRVRDNR